mgnify:CR=1 FL=1
MGVELIGVTKEYPHAGGTVKALKGIDLEIPTGDLISLMGPSGSGKSTLLNLIGCLDRPTAGTIKIEGVATNSLPDVELTKMRRNKIGFIFQSFNLIPYLTVIENVELPLFLKGVEEQERREEASKFLNGVGLVENFFTHLPSELSGGQCQRVAIARALANNPSIILADEPTGNLDRKTGDMTLRLIKELSEKFGKTVIVVTHDIKIAEYTNKKYLLEDGKIRD